MNRVKILGCGSAYHRGRVRRPADRGTGPIPAHAEPASEFRYRNPVIEPDTLYIAVTQSGETFDTLVAVQELKRKGGRVLGMVNAVGSAIASECDRGIYLHAGPEVAVVSTKTFTSTAVAFALFAYVSRPFPRPVGGRRRAAAHGAAGVAGAGRRASSRRRTEIAQLASDFANARRLLRRPGCRLPGAMEGALKLKEVSYVHAEAYPASELKHGPLALIDPDTPTLVVLPRDDLLREERRRRSRKSRRAAGRDIVVTHPVTVPARSTASSKCRSSSPSSTRSC